MCSAIRKTAIVNRAVPGAGKTTISKCIVEYLSAFGISVAIHSTDAFFMTDDGCYDFQLSKLYQNHRSNLLNFSNSLKSGTSVVICDNINIAPWQVAPYTDAARKYGYDIICITFAPRELEKHIQSQQVTLEKPDAHGVPKDVLIRFISEYELYNPLLCKSAPVHPEIHKDYFWNETSGMRKESGKPSAHFDIDFVIEILPDEYHEMRKKIGPVVYGLISEGGGR